MPNPFRFPPSVPALIASSLLLVACQGNRHAPEKPSSGATAVEPCTSAQLAVAQAGSDAGAGSRALHFTLHNTSAHTCTLKGHAGMRLLDAAGHPLAGVTVKQREDSDIQSPLTLPPGGSAWFQLIFPGATGGPPCHAVSAVEVTPPSGGAAQRLDLAFEVCGARVTVTPLQAPHT